MPQSLLQAKNQPQKPPPGPAPAPHQPSQWSDAYAPSSVPAAHQPYVTTPDGQGLAIAALVLGICSLVMFWCLLLGAPLAILAIVFGAMGMNKPGHGMAVAGLVMGAIELGLTAIFLVMGSMHMMWGPWRWH